MAEDKQLTVAELLARARKDTPEGEGQAPKRRRRRSLEDGGISVAELTGSFKAVKATPTQSRHSSVPLDAPADNSAAAPEKGKTDKDADEQPAADRSEPEKAQSEKTQSGKTEKPKSEADKAKAEKETGKKVDEKAAADRALLAKAKAKKEAAAAKEKAADKGADSDQQKAPSDDDTGVISTVAADTKAPQVVPGASETGELPRVDEVAEAETGTLAAQPAAQREGSLKAPGVGAAAPATAASAQDVDRADNDDSEDDDSGMNLGAVILLALLGIIGGIAIFLGFQFLWAHLNPWIVGIGALVVTGLMVGAVKWLRTSSDGLSMTLAGLVGLVITFGPAVLVFA